MGIGDPYLAFCFDEAIAHIQSYMYYNNKGILKWHKTPHWNDEKKQQNNSNLFNSMKKQLEKFKNTRR